MHSGDKVETKLDTGVQVASVLPVLQLQLQLQLPSKKKNHPRFNRNVFFQNDSSTMNIHNNMYCNNCRRKGHIHRKCPYPITSYGLITFRIQDGKLYFLMINRRHSINYLEYIKHRFIYYNQKTNSYYCNINQAKYIFEHLTIKEYEKIKLSAAEGPQGFENLWKNDIFKYNTFVKKYEFDQSMKKHKQFYKGIKSKYNHISLCNVMNKYKPLYTETEWGFPKGRSIEKEDFLTCAKREWKEETGLDDACVKMINTIPITEEYMGSNKVKYKITYYIGEYIDKDKDKDTPFKVNVGVDENNSQQCMEIRDVQWFTYEEVLRKIRPYYRDKKRIFNEVYLFLKSHLEK